MRDLIFLYYKLIYVRKLFSLTISHCQNGKLMDILPPYVHEISVCIFVFKFYKSDGNGNQGQTTHVNFAPELEQNQLMYRKISLAPIHLSQKNSLKLCTCEKCTMCESGHICYQDLFRLQKKGTCLYKEFGITRFKANITHV